MHNVILYQIILCDGIIADDNLHWIHVSTTCYDICKTHCCFKITRKALKAF